METTGNRACSPMHRYATARVTPGQAPERRGIRRVLTDMERSPFRFYR
ncbi:hypothetical protein [Methanosarcina mazei]|nr:hypothetical protein [Methanosarcina mazei]